MTDPGPGTQVVNDRVQTLLNPRRGQHAAVVAAAQERGGPLGDALVKGRVDESL